jgi:hypothetical protein
MSHARNRIVEVLLKYVDLDDIESAADQLMPIVCDTVAEGFETAADIIDHSASEAIPPELLRQWAHDAANVLVED